MVGRIHNPHCRVVRLYVEQTLLVTGVLDALHDSCAAGGKRIETPHLAKLAYTPAVELSSG